MKRVFDMPAPDGWSEEQFAALVGLRAELLTPQGVGSWFVESVEVRHGRLILTCEDPA